MNFVIDLHTGLFSSQYFQNRIQEETNRTHRTNLPFSVIFLDLSSLNSKHITKKTDKEKIVRIIGDTINTNSRETDLKGWFNDHTIAILLPSTPYSGAEVLSKKLIELGEARLTGCLQNGFRLEDCLAVASYPDNFTDSDSDSESGLGIKRLDLMHIVGNNDASVLRNSARNYFKKTDISQVPLFPDVFSTSYSLTLQIAVKRLIDIICSVIGIITFSPLMFITAVLIKLTSPGPVLFKQERIGFLGKKFTFLKFRSMYVSCDENRHKEYVTNLIKDDYHKANTTLCKMEYDPRVTPFGKFLRRSSLDELPQLFNVLKGEMTLVGPRPPIPYEVQHYENWHLKRIMAVKPGITGLWQVTGRSTTTFHEMVRLDISYANNWSLWLDVKILLRTVWAVISAKGAY